MLYQATKHKLLTFDSPLEKFKYETLPIVVDGLHDLIVSRDKQAIIETAKATVFKQYMVEEGIMDQSAFALALKIEMVPADVSIKSEPQIIGKGREVKGLLDGDVAE